MEYINLETQEEADQVLKVLRMILSRYGFVTKADLLQLVGIAHTYFDEKIGWKDLSSAKATLVGKLYQLELPPEESVEIEWKKRAIRHIKSPEPKINRNQRNGDYSNG